MSENIQKSQDNLLVRSESDDDVGIKSPSLSSLKTFRFKRSDSVTSQTSVTSSSVTQANNVSQRRKAGKFLFYYSHTLSVTPHKIMLFSKLF